MTSFNGHVIKTFILEGELVFDFEDILTCLTYPKKSFKMLKKKVPEKYRMDDKLVSEGGVVAFLLRSNKKIRHEFYEFFYDIVRESSCPLKNKISRIKKDISFCQVGKFLNGGGYGLVFDAGPDKVIKFSEHSLETENNFYSDLAEFKICPEIFKLGQISNINFLLQEKLFEIKKFDKQIAIGVVSALKVLSGKKILHRDIKPGNVMMRKTGDVVLIDFGLAVLKKDVETVQSKVCGTPSFMGRAAHMGIYVERNDLESVCYSLLENFISLPWKSKSENVFDLKEKFKNLVLNGHLSDTIPACEYNFICKVFSYRRTEIPDHDNLIAILSQ